MDEQTKKIQFIAYFTGSGVFECIFSDYTRQRADFSVEQWNFLQTFHAYREFFPVKNVSGWNRFDLYMG